MPKSYDSFAAYIIKVLKQFNETGEHKGKQISSKAVVVMDDIVSDTLHKLHIAMDSVMKSTPKKNTLTDKVAETAVRLTFPAELAKHAISEGYKAVVEFKKSASVKSAKSISRAKRAKIVFSVGRVDRALRDNHIHRVSPSCSVFTAAVLEYLTAEIIELACAAARDSKSMRITPRHINLVLRNDEELNKMVDSTVAKGGVMPNIAAVLLPKKPTASAAK